MSAPQKRQRPGGNQGEAHNDSGGQPDHSSADVTSDPFLRSVYLGPSPAYEARCFTDLDFLDSELAAAAALAQRMKHRPTRAGLLQLERDLRILHWCSSQALNMHWGTVVHGRDGVLN